VPPSPYRVPITLERSESPQALTESLRTPVSTNDSTFMTALHFAAGSSDLWLNLQYCATGPHIIRVRRGPITVYLDEVKGIPGTVNGISEILLAASDGLIEIQFASAQLGEMASLDRLDVVITRSRLPVVGPATITIQVPKTRWERLRDDVLIEVEDG